MKNCSNQDPLNFPIKLNNPLASLRCSIENGEAKPTDGAYKVFKELSAELAGDISKLETVLKADRGKLNEALKVKGSKVVSIQLLD